MILIDTSIWVRLLAKPQGERVQVEELFEAATCWPVIQEVLQGIRDDFSHRKLKEGLLSLPRLEDPLGEEIYAAAIDIYRLGRKQGHTIRSSVDCLIAAIAIKHGLPVWHADRDYDAIASFTSLKIRQSERGR